MIVVFSFTLVIVLSLFSLLVLVMLPIKSDVRLVDVVSKGIVLIDLLQITGSGTLLVLFLFLVFLKH